MTPRTLLLPVHITAGAIAIATGFIALSAMKGGSTHRRIGVAFVYAMIVMGLTGAVIAAWKARYGTALGGVLTAYFVVTAVVTVRKIPGWSRSLDVALMLVALTISLTSLGLGIATAASISGRREGLPPFPFFMTATVALLATVGDVRVMRGGALLGTKRLARHLWRMLWAFWVATGSFFLGQAKVIPKPIRIMPLLAAIAIIPLVAMLYWMWRVRVGRRLRGIAIPNAALVTAK
jgi:hypothetical protein